MEENQLVMLTPGQEVFTNTNKRSSSVGVVGVVGGVLVQAILPIQTKIHPTKSCYQLSSAGIKRDMWYFNVSYNLREGFVDISHKTKRIILFYNSNLIWS